MSKMSKTLSALNLAANIELVAPLLYAVAQTYKDDRPVELASLGTSLKKKVEVQVLANADGIMRTIDEEMNHLNLDVSKVSQFMSNCRQFVAFATDAKYGSLRYPCYNVDTLSTGVKVYNVGTKTNMEVKLDNETYIDIRKGRYISEYIPYSLLTIDAYNSIMDRIFIYKNEDNVMKEVHIRDFFLKLALIQDASIVLDSLFMNPDYILCLEVYKNSLRPISHPMCVSSVREHVWATFPTKPTFTEPSKANEGYVGFDVDLKGMATLSADGSTFHSFLDAKKFVARQEKLNGNRCVAMLQTKVFLVCESDVKSLPYFNTGCFYASHNLLMTGGVCRYTSDINNLLIKGVSHYAPWIIGEKGMNLSICASSSAKGGVAGLSAALGVPFNFEVMEEIPSFKEESITLLNGDTVKGVVVDVTLKITNAFTIENFWRKSEELEFSSLEEATAVQAAERVESLLGFNKEVARSLSVEMLTEVANRKATIIDVLSDAEAEGKVVLKPAVTTYTQAEFENIALTYGDDVATQLLEAVLSNSFNSKVGVETKAAAMWMLGTANKKAKIMPIGNILAILDEAITEFGVMNSSKIVNSLNTQFIRTVVERLGLCSDDLGWVHIPEMDVLIPTGKVLYKDLFKECNDTKLVFELPTILKYVISTCFYLVQSLVKGDLNPYLVKVSGMKLHFMIQDGLMNKKAAKLKAHGRYFTLLPGFWLKNKYDVCLLSRDLYQPQFSHLKWTKVNMAKHPVLFLQAVAGFRCFNEIPGIEVSDEIRALYANTIFVHPDYLLELQNDTDGDLARVTFDSYWLPLYTGSVMESCAKVFHQSYIDGENDIGVNLNKLPKHTTFSHEELYQAIQQASEAKMNVALFTDNLHKLQAAYRSSPVTANIVKAYGQEKGMKLVSDAIIVVATMIQTDAMNAIKHSGGVTAGSALTSVNITSEDGYAVAKEAMISYLDQHSITVEDKDVFAAVVCKLMLHTHHVGLNKRATLVNQYERLVFKDQPSEVYLEVDPKSGETYIRTRKANLYGKFADGTWNVTGDKSMFSVYLSKFYGRV